jgi:hypothetical protein
VSSCLGRSLAALLAEADGPRQPRAGLGVVRRHHRVVGRPHFSRYCSGVMLYCVTMRTRPDPDWRPDQRRVTLSTSGVVNVGARPIGPRQGSLGEFVRCQLVEIIAQEFGQSSTRPVGAALDRTDSDVANDGRLVIAHPVRPDEEQHLALLRRQARQCRLEILKVQLLELVRTDAQTLGEGTVDILNLARSLAVVGIECIAEDGEEPGQEVRSPTLGSRSERSIRCSAVSVADLID